MHKICQFNLELNLFTEKKLRILSPHINIEFLKRGNKSNKNQKITIYKGERERLKIEVVLDQKSTVNIDRQVVQVPAA